MNLGIVTPLNYLMLFYSYAVKRHLKNLRLDDAIIPELLEGTKEAPTLFTRKKMPHE